MEPFANKQAVELLNKSEQRWTGSECQSSFSEKSSGTLEGIQNHSSYADASTPRFVPWNGDKHVPPGPLPMPRSRYSMSYAAQQREIPYLHRNQQTHRRRRSDTWTPTIINDTMRVNAYTSSPDTISNGAIQAAQPIQEQYVPSQSPQHQLPSVSKLETQCPDPPRPAPMPVDFKGLKEELDIPLARPNFIERCHHCGRKLERVDKRTPNDLIAEYTCPKGCR